MKITASTIIKDHRRGTDELVLSDFGKIEILVAALEKNRKAMRNVVRRVNQRHIKKLRHYFAELEQDLQGSRDAEDGHQIQYDDGSIAGATEVLKILNIDLEKA